MLDLSRLGLFFEYNKTLLAKGREYMKRGAIRDISSYNDGIGTSVQAKIKGSKLYRTIIMFDRNGQYRDAYCSCPAHQNSDGGMCKHVASLYLYLKENKMENINKISAAKEFLGQYLNTDEEITYRRTVNVVYEIEYIPSWARPAWEISLKMGFEKLYVIKNIQEFVECIINGGKIEFGKKFSFNSRIHSFSEEDRKILGLFADIYTFENLLKDSFNTGYRNIFSGKTIKLDENMFIRLCSMLGNRKVVFTQNGEVSSDVRITPGEAPYSISISDDGNVMTAVLERTGDLDFLGNMDRLVYIDDRIYLLDNVQKSYNFFKIFKKRNISGMEFAGDDRQNLLSIIPEFINDKNIKIDQNILSQYIKEELTAKLYIDKFKRGISIIVEFDYDEININPFSSKKISPFIIRDYNREENIIKLIEDSEFKIKDARVYLDDYDRIYAFFNDMIPVLSNLCTIYYTDEVKNFYMGRIKSYKSYISKGFRSDLIDINLEIEGVENEDINGLMKSIIQRKKYHKLKSGKLISLEGDAAEVIYNILEKVENEEINDNKISLSKYRAFGLLEDFEQNKEIIIQNSEDVFKMINKIKNSNEENIEVPGIFNNVLRDYQVSGFKWLKVLEETGFAGILADDMGLGKTIQAISLICSNKESNPSIVISPSSLVYNWESEFRKFAPDVKTLVMAGNKSLREEMINNLLDYDVVITSYPLLRRDIELYNGITFQYCIIDEAQHIKNPDSINAQSVKQINSNHRFALTGTPIENSLIELWSIFDFLMPGYLLSKNRFIEKYEKNAYRNDEGNSIGTLRRLISPFILRRKKRDVLKELPDKIETKLICELTEEQRKLYYTFIAKTREEIEERVRTEGFERSRIQIIALITRLRQICCHPSMFIENYSGGSGKLELLEELIDELIGGEHRILLFSQFTTLLEIVRARLEEKAISYKYLDGTTPIYKRMQMVESFNAGEGSIFLISLKAGGTGLNLTSADSVIHYDPWWNPAVEEQATDRAHRIGQENVVEVFKLITKDTIEEKIFELQNKKKDLINSVIQEGETFLNKLTEEEIMNLFKIDN